MSAAATARDHSHSRDAPAAALSVALLSPRTWPETRRGAERMFRDLAGGLLARGHHPRLITSYRGLPSTTVEGGVEISRSWRPPDRRLRRRGYEDDLTHVPASYIALLRRRADIAHASHAPDAVAAVCWARRSGRPSVFSFMGIPDRRWLVARRLRLQCMLEAVAGADAVVALSRAAAHAFEYELGVRARVINPGVDLKAFTPGGSRSPSPTIVCAAPPDVPEKRVGLLVDAFALLRRERPDVTLRLQRPSDHALAAGLRSTPGVELVEPDPGLLEGEYRHAWVSVLPSASEPFGLVAAESLACGTPVIASDRGGLPEIVDSPEIGGVFSGEDPADVARCLFEGLELAAEPTTAARCRARAEQLSIDACVAAYEALYRELLGA